MDFGVHGIRARLADATLAASRPGPGILLVAKPPGDVSPVLFFGPAGRFRPRSLDRFVSEPHPKLTF